MAALADACVCVCFQTIVSAMSALTPPIALGNPANQFRVDYIKSITPLSDFEYTEVTHTLLPDYRPSTDQPITM